MGGTTARVTVTTTAGLLDPTLGSFPLSRSFLVANIGAATVHLGSSAAVTTSTGLPLAAGETYVADLGKDERVYGIVASGTVVVATQLLGG